MHATRVDSIHSQCDRSRRKVLVISPHRCRVRSYFGLPPDANYDSESILAFLKQVARTRRVLIVLVWDRLPAHRGEPVARMARAQLSLRAGASAAGVVRPGVELSGQLLRPGRVS